MEPTTPSPWTGIISTLAELPASEPAKPRQQFNPHPRGCILPVGTTAQFLVLFTENPLRFFTEKSLREETGATHAAASWALHLLKSKGRVEAFSYNAVRSGPLAYRLAKKSKPTTEVGCFNLPVELGAPQNSNMISESKCQETGPEPTVKI